MNNLEWLMSLHADPWDYVPGVERGIFKVYEGFYGSTDARRLYVARIDALDADAPVLDADSPLVQHVLSELESGRMATTDQGWVHTTIDEWAFALEKYSVQPFVKFEVGGKTIYLTDNYWRGVLDGATEATVSACPKASDHPIKIQVGYDRTAFLQPARVDDYQMIRATNRQVQLSRRFFAILKYHNKLSDNMTYIDSEATRLDLQRLGRAASLMNRLQEAIYK